MSFFGFGKKKSKDTDTTAAREELFKAPEPKAPAKSGTSSGSSSSASTRPSSSAGSTKSSSTYTSQPLESINKTYSSEKEQYDALVAERRGLDQSSLESTRRSVNRIAEAEMLASGNLSKLSTQGGETIMGGTGLDKGGDVC